MNHITKKYVSSRDIKSCQEMTSRIESVIKSGKDNFRFGGNFYGNVDCEEFNEMKFRYRNKAEFDIYGPVSDKKFVNVSKNKNRNKY
jgi:hypothetical protein